jgi:DNA topoisomerase VI subunit B
MFKNLTTNLPIIPAHTAIKTFRDNGYKDTASAISELIDNSIDAKAKNIQILVFEKTSIKSNRQTNQITEIVIVDDGIGMNEEVLMTSLQFGNGTKSDSDEDLGKFGIGLPNASVSQCKRVEVYSWRNSKYLYTYLDIDENEKKKTTEYQLNSIKKFTRLYF